MPSLAFTHASAPSPTEALLPFVHCPDGVLLLDRNGILKDLNPAAERMLCLRAPSVQGQPLSQLLPVVKGASSLRHLVEWLKQEVLSPLGKRTSWTGKACAQVAQTNEVLEMDVTAFASGTAAGDCLTLILRDITLRRLQERGVRLRDQAILASGTGIALFDAGTPEPVIVYVNPAVEAMTGLRVEELLGCTSDVLQAPCANDVADAPTVTSLLQAKQPGTVIARHQRGNDAEGWSQITLSAVVGDDSHANTFIGIFTDITDRILAERVLTMANADLDRLVQERTRDLQEKEERFRNILSSLDEVVFSDPADPQFPAYVSPSAAKILGYPQETVAARGQFDLEGVLLSDRKSVQEFKQEVFKNGYAALDYRVRRVDGQIRWLHHRARLIRDASGILARVDGYVLDVTDQKMTESELILAREAADQANRAKDEFLAAMSHEIRTPLQCIFGYTDLLEASSPNPKQQHFLNIIRTQSSNLLQIVNDILDFSKLQSGKVELELLPFTLRALVAETLHAFAPAAAGKKLLLESFVDPHLPEQLVGDRTRLGQVLTNLVGNAIKFTDSGRVDIRVEQVTGAPAPEDNAIFLRVSVADTGIGIPPEKMGRLFRSFTQVDSSTTRKYGGSGLGLAVCKRLVEMMDGLIWVDAASSSSGSTFHFTFKARISSKELPREDAHPGGSAKLDPGFARQHPATILVVEDNAPALETALELLKALGYQPTGAPHAHQALELLAQERFDTILMDVQMPDMDGLQTTRLIRERFVTPRPRIIAMTANAFASDRELCLNAGMDEFISKPVSLARLKQILARVQVTAPSPDVQDSSITLDERILHELEQLNPSVRPSPLLLRLEATLRQDTPQLLERIQCAANASNAAELESAAHNLKGAAHVLGAHRMVHFCALLVDMARSQQLEHAASTARELAAEFQAVLQAFSNYLECSPQKKKLTI